MAQLSNPISLTPRTRERPARTPSSRQAGAGNSIDRLSGLRAVGAVKEALLAQSLGDSKARCNICQRRCLIKEGGVGSCRTIVNDEGKLYTTIYGVISSAAADPIEKKPVFHFKPGSRVFSVGTLGCNFRCVFCQNWQIAFADAVESEPGLCQTGITPERLVNLAKSHGCAGVAWTYNEPGIWLNYTLDCAKLCKDAGLYTVYVTNGYATPEHLDLIGPYLDVYRVDLKSMDDHFYKELIKVPSVQGILDVAIRAKEQWGMHVECVTNVIPGWNDTEDNLRRTATWIHDRLGENTPGTSPGSSLTANSPTSRRHPPKPSKPPSESAANPASSSSTSATSHPTPAKTHTARSAVTSLSGGQDTMPALWASQAGVRAVSMDLI